MSKAKFKKGDRVKIVKPASRYNDATGTVEEVHNSLVCLILDSNGHAAYFGSAYVKHLLPAPKADNKSLWDALDEDIDE